MNIVQRDFKGVVVYVGTYKIHLKTVNIVCRVSSSLEKRLISFDVGLQCIWFVAFLCLVVFSYII